ncbi:hypothetical protein VdG1_03789 [Verticillium dahliae VDG1]|nr:hypothetical protein VdG1_03789 [Verticillium dahliae VDG1]
MNGLNTVFSFCGGIVGSFFVDRVGRRPLLLWGVFLTGLIYVPINVLAGLADGNIERASGYAFIGMMFLYGIVSSFCWTPLHALYPAEVLSTDIRGKGLAANNLIAGLFGFINLYAIPTGLENIGWRIQTAMPSAQSHSRSHSLLLLQKLLNLRDGASPLTLVLDNLEQSATPVIRELITRAKMGKSKVIFLSFATLKKPRDMDVLVKGRGKALTALRTEILSHYPKPDEQADKAKRKPSQRQGAEGGAGQDEGEPASTFSLGLTEKQRRDRDGIVLPYFDAQTDIGAGEGGRILYEMGREDDFDEEEDEI